MALPGVYTKEEQKMLAQWDSVEQEVGWLGDSRVPGEVEYAVIRRVATKELIMQLANCINDPNPLWSDDNYARQTRWGSIIAPPSFVISVASQGKINLRKIPPEVGFARSLDRGAPQRPYTAVWGVLGSWEYFKPIRPGDSFRVWCGPNIHDDITSLEGKGIRTFRLDDQLRYYNQKNELIAIYHKTLPFSIVSKAEAPLLKPNPRLEEYKYTKEELDFIDRTMDEEIIRGAKIQWWEDIKVGEELTPIVEGPMTLWGQVKAMAVRASAEVERRPTPSAKSHKPVQDPDTGVWYRPIESHLSDKAGQLLDHPQAVIIMHTWMNALNRLVTNWMGDDGFLKRTGWERLADNPLGDTLVGRGKVIKKYVQDDGEHVVDIACWLENMRGYITNAGVATVGLFSRKSVDKDLMRY